MKKGICVAGNAIVDLLYPIDRYPNEGELTTIRDVKKSTGGALCNVIIDLAKLDSELPLYAVGQIGTDDNALLIKEKLGQHKNINTEGIKEKGQTSFTAVMNSIKSKQRTFFFYRGADSELCEDHFDWDKLKENVELLHIGYILLLDALDAEDDEYGTKMARLLAKAKEHGIKTSIDIVSEAGNRFKKIVPPAIKYVDYCIINEIEAQQATGVTLHDGTRLLTENMKEALKALFNMGVSTWAVIHAREGAYAMDEKGEYFEIESLELPDGYIKGTVGAGDAFCSGVLFGAYKGKSLAESLEIGIATASCSLSEEGSTEGVRSYEATMEFYKSMR